MKRLVAIAALALAACRTIPGAESGPAAGLGQVATVEGLRIRPLQVIEDSRCPINAVCVWAGRLVLRAQITGRARAEVADLTLGTPLQVGEFAVTLVSAEPSNLAGTAIKDSDRRFTFAVIRGR